MPSPRILISRLKPIVVLQELRTTTAKAAAIIGIAFITAVDNPYPAGRKSPFSTLVQLPAQRHNAVANLERGMFQVLQGRFLIRVLFRIA